MARQNAPRRSTQGRTQNVQRTAHHLSALRAQYEEMGPDHPGFDEALGEATLLGGDLDANVRRMSRPDGSSRRAAGERFLARSVLAQGSEVVLPEAWRDYAVHTASGPLGATASAEFKIDYAEIAAA